MTIKLEAQAWNAVLGALGKTAYETAMPLINAINEQLQVQAEHHAAGGNGLDLTPVAAERPSDAAA
jgi:hypothetical protein